MTKNWTPEPNNLAKMVGRSEASFEMNGHRFTIKGYVGGQCMNTMQANAESRKKTVARIVACVNAMAGVDDPQSFVERAYSADSLLDAYCRQHRELVEALEKYARHDSDCSLWAKGATVCSCGLTSALKRAKGE
jgi:hypothetical protein